MSSTRTTRSRALGGARVLLAAGLLAAGLAAIPSPAHAMREDTAVGTRQWVPIASGPGRVCQVWASSGSSWVYMGIYPC